MTISNVLSDKHDQFIWSDDKPWERKSKQWESFRQYWQDKGKEAFETYLKKAHEQEDPIEERTEI